MGVGDGGEVGVDGGTGVAVGATGVDSSEPGEGVSAGVSVETGLEPTSAVPVASFGVPLSIATPGDSLPPVRVEKAAKAPTHITSRTKKNAIAEPLFCIEVTHPSRDP